MGLEEFMNIIRSQGLIAGSFLIILFSLLCFFRKTINNAKQREEKLTELLSNTEKEHSESLVTISGNTKEIARAMQSATQEHRKIMEMLIRIEERIKV